MNMKRKGECWNSVLKSKTSRFLEKQGKCLISKWALAGIYIHGMAGHEERKLVLYTKTFIVVKKSRKFFKARPAAKAIEISNSTSIFFRRGKGRHSKNSVKEFWKIFSNSCTYQSLPECPVTISPRVDIKLQTGTKFPTIFYCLWSFDTSSSTPQSMRMRNIVY